MSGKSLIDSKVLCAEVSSLATAPAPAAQNCALGVFSLKACDPTGEGMDYCHQLAEITATRLHKALAGG